MLRDVFELEAEALWGELRRLSERIPRLDALTTRDADPRVARLVQSAAFALASARSRRGDGGQSLLRPLIAAALPEALRPRPATTIVELANAARLGTTIGAQWTARVGGDRVPFETSWPTTIAPVEIHRAWIDRIHAQLQVLRFELSGRPGVFLGNAIPETLRIFVHLEPRSTAIDVIHALKSSRDAASVRLFSERGEVLANLSLPGALAWVRVDTDEPPVACASDRFASSTLLRDLFQFPESFCFLDLRVSSLRDPRVARAELALPLSRVVPGAERLAADGVRLHCAPAVNQFVSAIAPLRAVDPERQWTLAVARRPHAEILQVRSLYAESVRDAARRIELRSWEAPSSPHRFDAGDTLYVLEPRAAVSDDRSELTISFTNLRTDRILPPGPLVQGEVVASDGARADAIGIGEVVAGVDAGRNITRVAPSRRAPLASNEGWRFNAYARMPSIGIARHLDTFLALHESPVLAEAGVRIGRPRFSGMRHEHAHAAEGGRLRWGDAFHIEVDAAGCTEGETWLFGALLHRTLAERIERLRFCSLLLSQGGQTKIEYPPRSGERLPLPFG